MFAEKIIQALTNNGKNIIFFFDPEGSKKEELQSLEEVGVKVVEVKHNYFELKYKLANEWSETKLLLYHNFKKPEGKKIKYYPLLDLLAANVELKLDEVSEFIADNRLNENFKGIIEKYWKLLKPKGNQKKLANLLDSENFSADNLQRGLISILLEYNSIEEKLNCMNKWLSLTLNENKFSKINNVLRDFELDEILVKWFNTLLDTQEEILSNESAELWVTKLKYNVLAANIKKTSANDTYTSLKIKRAADTFKIIKFFEIWQKNVATRSAIEPVFSSIGKRINTTLILKWYGTENQYLYYSKEMSSEILNGLYSELRNYPLKTKEACIRWRNEENDNEYINNQIDFLYYASTMYSILENYKGYRFNSAEKFIEEYTTELHKVDYNYRKSVIAFDMVRDHLEEFETEAIKSFDKLNHNYDRFLIEFNTEWQNLLKENEFNFHQINCNKQFNFYNDNLRQVDYKMAVIISDAFRYEIGYELYEDLLADSKNILTIEPCLASVPSYTNLGMSNLLPNNGISVERGDQDLIYKINGKATTSQYRQSILQESVPDSVTIDYSEIIKFDQATGRKFFIKNKLVYIYHDWMDAIGDKSGTEHETFNETAKVVDQIKKLIKKIHSFNILHITITADHGFLFNYNKLKVNDREVLPKAKGYCKDNSRFVIADDFEPRQEGYIFDMKNTTNCDTDLKIAIPRAINRYRKQGNIGIQFVHGGASLQELITPVIKYYKQKKETSETVSFKRLGSANKITTGNIKVNLLQNEPVSNELKSLDIAIGLFSDNGDLISNEVLLALNSTSLNPKEREFEVLLTINTAGAKLSFCYLKAYRPKDKINPYINELITISTLMGMDF